MDQLERLRPHLEASHVARQELLAQDAEAAKQAHATAERNAQLRASMEAAEAALGAGAAVPSVADSLKRFHDKFGPPQDTTVIARGTASDPIGTTSDPIRTASDPIGTTSDPIGTPSDPIGTTSDPIGTTSDALHSTHPSMPSYSMPPDVPLYTPTPTHTHTHTHTPQYLSEGGQPLRCVRVPGCIVQQFLQLAGPNTRSNLETCGVLAGRLQHDVFTITTLIVPKQTATSDTCAMSNEEEIVDTQDRLDVLSLGWIHVRTSTPSTPLSFLL
mgnify:CR=1 FL=1